MARPFTLAQRTLASGPQYWLYGYLEIKNVDGVWIDVTNLEGINWFEGARWGEDIDIGIASCTIWLRRNVGDYSLAPSMQASVINRDSLGNYAPLLNGGREFRLRTAQVPVGTESIDVLDADKIEVFIGKLDSVDWTKNPVVVEGRDRGAWVGHSFIKAEKTYSTDTGEPIETVMGQLLIDYPPKGNPTLVTIGSPNYFIRAYKQTRTNLLDALKTLAAEPAWDVRYWYDTDGVSKFILQQPPRDKTVEDYTLSPSEYLSVRQIKQTDVNVKNSADIVFIDQATGTVARINTINQASIDEFGERWFELDEPYSTNITTVASATTLGQALVSDLGTPDADQEVTTKYLWFIQLWDLIKFPPNTKHYDVDERFAVMSYQHEIKNSAGNTTIRARGKLAGLYRTWLNRFGLTSKQIFGAPNPIFTITAEGSPDGGVTKDGRVWVDVQFDPNTEYCVVFSETGPTSPVPVPDESVITHNATIRRPLGIIPADPFYETKIGIATTNGWYRCVKCYGVGPDGQKSVPFILEVRAGLPSTPSGSTLPGFSLFDAVWTLDGVQLSWTIDAGVVPPGTVIYVTRNGQVINGAGFPTTFTGYLDTAAPRGSTTTYTVFLFNAGDSGPASIFVLGPDTSVIKPIFTNGTPLWANSGFTIVGPLGVYIAWSCADPASRQILVQWSGDNQNWSTIFTSIVDAATAANGNTTTQTVSRGYYRLVSRDGSGNILAYGDAVPWAGTTTPPPVGPAPFEGALSIGTTAVSVHIPWTCADASAAKILIQQSTTAVGPWTTLTSSLSVAVGAINHAEDYNTVFYYRVCSADVSDNIINPSNVRQWIIGPASSSSGGTPTPV